MQLATIENATLQEVEDSLDTKGGKLDANYEGKLQALNTIGECIAELMRTFGTSKSIKDGVNGEISKTLS